MGLFDFLANLDVEIMCASSRAWAAREEREAERRYRENKKVSSVSTTEKKKTNLIEKKQKIN